MLYESSANAYSPLLTKRLCSRNSFVSRLPKNHNTYSYGNCVLQVICISRLFIMSHQSTLFPMAGAVTSVLLNLTTRFTVAPREAQFVLRCEDLSILLPQWTVLKAQRNRN